MSSQIGPNGQLFAIFEDGHERQLPRLHSGPFKYKTYAADNFKLSKSWTDADMKCCVIAPSMLYLLYPPEGIDGYSINAFCKDLVSECVHDIRRCFAAGAKRVTIDFTEGRLALKNDSRLESSLLADRL
jgi:hypothetical protein